MARTKRDYRWYHAEIVLREYKKNKETLRQMEHEVPLRTPNKPEINSSPTNRTTDSTATMGIDLAENMVLTQYRVSIAAVDEVFAMYNRHRRWREIYKGIDLVYWRGTHTMTGAADVVHLARSKLGAYISGVIWAIEEVLYGKR
jgi:hypothetical protein